MPTDPTKARIEKTFAHDSPLMACRFDPTGRFVFAGAQDYRVWRWDIASGTKTPFVGHDSWVRSIAFDPKGETLITGGFEGKLIWWSATAEQPAPLRTIEAHAGWIRAIAVSRDGQLLASCGNDLVVRIWNLADGTKLQELRGLESHIYFGLFHPNNKEFVAGDLKANYVHWDAATGNVVRKFTTPALYKYDPGFLADIGGPHSMAFSEDGNTLACAGITNVSNAFAGVGNPAVVVLEWETLKEKVTHLSKGGVQGVCWGTALHPDGYTIGATGGPGGGHLFFWKPDQKDEFHSFNLGNTARDMSLHPDRSRVATAHFDKQLRITTLAPPA